MDEKNPTQGLDIEPASLEELESIDPIFKNLSQDMKGSSKSKESQATQEEYPSPQSSAVFGGGAGLAAGVASKLLYSPEAPSFKQYENAVNRLKTAERNLAELTFSKAPSDIILKAQEDVVSARSALTEVLPDALSRKIPGASGVENYARVMSPNVLPDVIASQVESMKAETPRGTGTYQILEKDAEAMARAKALGLGEYQLSGKGPGQLMLPPDIAASREPALIEQARQSQLEELRRTEAVEQARKRLELIQKAEEELASAKGGLEQVKTQTAPTSHRAKQIGYAIAKNPIIANVLAGIGTGFAGQEAYNQYQQGNIPAAISSGIEAGFGGLSMLPFLPAKAIGGIGGLSTALGKYIADKLGEKFEFGISPEAKRVVQRQ